MSHRFSLRLRRLAMLWVASLSFVAFVGAGLAWWAGGHSGHGAGVVLADVATPAPYAGMMPAFDTTVAAQYPAMSWMAKLLPRPIGETVALACLDANGDRRLSAADGAPFSGIDIPLVRDAGCLPPGQRREVFDAEPASLRCDPLAPRPVLVIAVAGGGTQLLDRREGVSTGLIDIVNGVRAGTDADGIASGVMLMTSAIEAADLPQTRMEEWLAAELRRRFDATPCLRAVLVGHSHGAVLITSVLAALEREYADRLFGVLLDRSLLYYDHETYVIPKRAALFNVYQTNEGWHGGQFPTANVENYDASAENAPLDPRASPLPIVAVAHSTLDDSPGVQARVVAAVMAWLRH